MDLTSYLLGKKAGGGSASQNNAYIEYNNLYSSRNGGIKTIIKKIENLDVTQERSGANMFEQCRSLESISFAGNTSKFTSTASMFSYCSSLKEVPLFDTSNVTTMSLMFNYCTELETVPIFNTSKATAINQMFSGCTKLSNDSLNNILAMCINATSFTGTKTLQHLSLTETQAATCEGLSNYQAFLNAGWTTGY